MDDPHFDLHTHGLDVNLGAPAVKSLLDRLKQRLREAGRGKVEEEHRSTDTSVEVRAGHEAPLRRTELDTAPAPNAQPDRKHPSAPRPGDKPLQQQPPQPHGAQTKKAFLSKARRTQPPRTVATIWGLAASPSAATATSWLGHEPAEPATLLSGATLAAAQPEQAASGRATAKTPQFGLFGAGAADQAPAQEAPHWASQTLPPPASPFGHVATDPSPAPSPFDGASPFGPTPDQPKDRFF